MELGTSRVPFEFDYIEEESDEDRGQDSSEDELDIILHGTPEQKRKLSRSLSRGSLELSSSEDDFEKDMEKELNETLHHYEQKYRSLKVNPSPSGTQVVSSPSGSSTVNSSGNQEGNKSSSLAQQFYDDIYFDSDSNSDEEMENKEKRNKDKKLKKQKLKHRIMSNEELYYDPNIDDENQRWVDRQRQKYRNQQQQKSLATKDSAVATSDENIPSSSIPIQPKSDAVLNCPACLTTLCLDCQRHELYNNQYRAMFVINCSILRSEQLKYPVPKKNKRWKKNQGKREGKEAEEASSNTETGKRNSEELYHPVKCTVCNTEVGVYDVDEVFHFFNVLASTA